jgi:hypothetical protein
MSAQELIFSCGDLQITVGPSGFPTRAEHPRRPGHNYLAGQDAPGRMIIDGREQSWEFAGSITDVAESEARYAVRDHPQLEYTVRNSFTGSWLQRHMLLNTSSAPVQVDDLVLPLLPGEGSVGWARTAADEISWMVQPADGSGPLLVGELTSGAISRLAEDGFRTGRLVLPANRRYVLQWRIESAADAISVTRSRPTLSPRTELPTGEPYEIADPDTAIVVDDPVSVSQESFPLHGSVQVVVSSTPGRYPIELRSSRGTSRIDLTWVPSTDEVITELSGSWIGGRRSSAGVALLPAAGAALGLQHAVIGRLIDVDEEAEDVLALHGARLLDQERLSIMEQAFLAQEAVRTGDPEPLQRARAALLEVEEVQPGLGLAGTRLCLAELALGGSPAEVIGRLRELGTAANQAAEQNDQQVGDGHLLDEAAKLEMIAVTGPAVVGGTTASVLPHALAVGAELGSGLPGRRLESLGPANAVYAAAVLDLLPDDLGPELQRRWGVTPHTLAERTRTSALASALWPVGPSTSSGSGTSTSSGSASGGELAEAIGWLVLGRPIE